VLLLSVESSLDTTSEAVDRTIADGIAQQVLDQILTRRFAEEDSGSGSLGPGADELVGLGSELFDDVDDFAGFVMQPPEDPLGQPLGSGDDQGGQRLANFRAPAGFLQTWRVRCEVYYVHADDHRTISASPTPYRGIEVFVEKLKPDGTAIPLANRKRIVSYVPPPES
jgi:hypothetical protein